MYQSPLAEFPTPTLLPTFQTFIVWFARGDCQPTFHHRKCVCIGQVNEHMHGQFQGREGGQQQSHGPDKRVVPFCVGLKCSTMPWHPWHRFQTSIPEKGSTHGVRRDDDSSWLVHFCLAASGKSRVHLPFLNSPPSLCPLCIHSGRFTNFFAWTYFLIF